MNAQRRSIGGVSGITLDLKPNEEDALYKALDYLLEESFQRLEEDEGFILEEDEHAIVASIFTAIWPDGGKGGW